MKSQQSGRDASTTPLVTPDVDAMPGHGRQTVLIVEDVAPLRDAYWAALLEAGFRGVATPNGNNILDVMYTENVSVILLDLFKPGMDGIETLKAIKRVSPETLVVAMGETGGQLDCLAVATQLGADAFVKKPALPGEVVDAVTALTSQSAAISQTDRRRYTRLHVDQLGYLYNPPHGKPLACRVMDLSAGGALIQSESECPQGRPLVLHVGGFGSFEGIVVRSAAGSAGFKFLMGELKRDRLKKALASFAKTGVAPIATYGLHPNFKPGGHVPHVERREDPVRKDIFPFM
jgi:DNA-binding response OmpR family regulator